MDPKAARQRRLNVSRKLVHYSAEQKSQAMRTLVANDGALQKTADDLQVLWGHAPHPGTVSRWKSERPEVYEAAKERHLTEVKDRIRVQRITSINLAGELGLRVLREIETALDRGEIEAKDLGGLLKNLALKSAIDQDKLNLSEGTPTVIRQELTAEEALRSLGERFGVWGDEASVYDTTAEEE